MRGPLRMMELHSCPRDVRVGSPGSEPLPEKGHTVSRKGGRRSATWCLSNTLPTVGGSNRPFQSQSSGSLARSWALGKAALLRRMSTMPTG
jgi:hypothetical protein